MFAGHVGAGLAIARAERRINAGVFIAAALLVDFLLWLFVLLGWESVVIPLDFPSTHQALFVFPYSHGLVASLAWSVVAGVAGLIGYARLQAAKRRAATLIAAAVFSHWILDAIVHQPELPITGANSPKLGLGLWQSMPAALGAEAAIVIAGLLLLLPGSRLSRRRLFALAALALLILAFTVVGMTLAPPAPSAFVMAASSLVTLLLVCALACWLGRLPP